jgi:hypothetical protein
LPPQAYSPIGQLVVQTPPEQISPAAQTFPISALEQDPAAPQKARSVRGSTHFPLQVAWPGGQLLPHAPPAQTCPAAQTAPACGPVQAPLAPQC